MTDDFAVDDDVGEVVELFFATSEHLAGDDRAGGRWEGIDQEAIRADLAEGGINVGFDGIQETPADAGELAGAALPADVQGILPDRRAVDEVETERSGDGFGGVDGVDPNCRSLRNSTA